MACKSFQRSFDTLHRLKVANRTVQGYQSSNDRCWFSEFCFGLLNCKVATNRWPSSDVGAGTFTQFRQVLRRQSVHHSTLTGTAWNECAEELSTNGDVHALKRIHENIFLHHKASSQQHSSHTVTDQERTEAYRQEDRYIDSADNKPVNHRLRGLK